MNLNKKGFMMAEVVVVSAVVIIFLASVYVSYNQIYGKYKSRVTYYDSVALYQLAYYRDSLIDNNKLVDLLNDVKTSNVKKVDDISGTDRNIFIIYNNKNNLNGKELDGIDGIHATFKDYIAYLSTSADLTDSDYVMVMETCKTEDDCKYAYLKVYDGTAPESPSSSDNPGSGGPSVENGGSCSVPDFKVLCNGRQVNATCESGSITRYLNSCSTNPKPDFYYKEVCNASCHYWCNGKLQTTPGSYENVRYC